MWNTTALRGCGARHLLHAAKRVALAPLSALYDPPVRLYYRNKGISRGARSGSTTEAETAAAGTTIASDEEGRLSLIGKVGLVVVALSLVLVIGLDIARALPPPSPAGPVYTVAMVKAGLRLHPRAWVGRTVLVQGRVAGSMSWGQSGHPLTNTLYPPPGLNIRCAGYLLYPCEEKSFFVAWIQ